MGASSQGVLDFLQVYNVGVVTLYLCNRILQSNGRLVWGGFIPYLTKLHVELDDSERFHAVNRGAGLERDEWGSRGQRRGSAAPGEEAAEASAAGFSLPAVVTETV